MIDVLVEEARDAKEAFARPRRTSLENLGSSSADIDVDEGPPKDNILTLSERGYVKRICPKNFGAQNRGTRGKRMSKLRANDELSAAMHCMDTDSLLFFSDRGRLQKISAKIIPQAERNTVGVPVTSVLATFAKRNQTVSAVLSTDLTLDSVEDDQVIVMLTHPGIKGVMIPTLWHDAPPYGTDHYDKFWAACAEAGLVIHTHSGEADFPSYGDNM